jgi:hypothetical protein
MIMITIILLLMLITSITMIITVLFIWKVTMKDNNTMMVATTITTIAMKAVGYITVRIITMIKRNLATRQTKLSTTMTTKATMTATMIMTTEYIHITNNDSNK